MLETLLIQAVSVFVWTWLYYRLIDSPFTCKDSLEIGLALVVSKIFEVALGFPFDLIYMILLSSIRSYQMTWVERWMQIFYPLVTMDILLQSFDVLILSGLFDTSLDSAKHSIWLAPMTILAVIPFVYVFGSSLQIDVNEMMRQDKGIKNRYRFYFILSLIIYYIGVSLARSNRLEVTFLETYDALLIIGYLMLFAWLLVETNRLSKQRLQEQLEREQLAYLEDMLAKNRELEHIYQELDAVDKGYRKLITRIKEKTEQVNLPSLASVEKQWAYESHQLKQQVAHIPSFSLRQMLLSKITEIMAKGITLHLDIPEPLIESSIGDLDLVILVSKLLDKAVEETIKTNQANISLAFFDDSLQQCLIVDHYVIHEEVKKSYPDQEMSLILTKYPAITYSCQKLPKRYRQVLEMR